MVRRRAAKLRGILRQWQPDLVHALRLPFEGMLATAADPAAPLVISTWGNDLTLHAPASPMMRWSTRRSLRRAAGLHSDCRRDEQLAARWGFRAVRPTLVIPGNGGVRREVFFAGRRANDPDFGIDPAPVVVSRQAASLRPRRFFLPRHPTHPPTAADRSPAYDGAAEAKLAVETHLGQSCGCCRRWARLDGRPLPAGGGIGFAEHPRRNALLPKRWPAAASSGQ
jgi:hypothetical protein